ncbi:MAG: hypothetical protein K2Y37_08295 [Pirellulales bacterium]|nr:hypothetical protein [Pirellulales bacterium]
MSLRQPWRWSPGRAGNQGVRVGLGLLLLCAAALKGHALVVVTGASRGLLISPGPGALLIAAELSLGLWLLSGLARQGSWWVALVGFAGLSCVSLTKALAGVASCGCFGVLAVSPWVVFGLDVAAVASLIAFRSPAAVGVAAGINVAPRQSPRELLAWAAWPASIACLAVAGLAIWGLLVFGSWRTMLLSVQGYTLMPESFVKSVGEIPAGQRRNVVCELTNLKSHEVTVLGAKTTCGRFVPANLPVRIGPHEKGAVVFQALASEALDSEASVGQPFASAALLYLDGPGRPIVLVLKGTISASKRGSNGRRDRDNE